MQPLNKITIYEGGFLTQLRVGLFTITEPTPVEFRIRILTLPDSLAGITLFAGNNTVSVDEVYDIGSQNLSLVISPSANFDASFTYEIVNKGGMATSAPQEFEIDIIPVDVKSLFLSSLQTTAFVTNDYLNIGDSSNDSTQIVYSLREELLFGTLQKQNDEGAWVDLQHGQAGSTFTQADVDTHKIRYEINNGAIFNEHESLSFTVTDSANGDLTSVINFEIAQRELIRVPLDARENESSSSGNKVPASRKNLLDYKNEERGIDLRATEKKDIIIGTEFSDKIDGGDLDDEINLDYNKSDTQTGGSDEVVLRVGGGSTGGGSNGATGSNGGGTAIRLTSGGDVIRNFHRGEDVLSFVNSNPQGQGGADFLASFETSVMYDYANGTVIGLYFVFKETISLSASGLSGNIIQVYFDEAVEFGTFYNEIDKALDLASNTIRADTPAGTFAAIGRALGGEQTLKIEVVPYIETFLAPRDISAEFAVDADKAQILRSGWQFKVRSQTDNLGVVQPYNFIIENADGSLNEEMGVWFSNSEMARLSALPVYELVISSSFTDKSGTFKIIPIGADGVAGAAGLVEFDSIQLGADIMFGTQDERIVAGRAVASTQGFFDLSLSLTIAGRNASEYYFTINNSDGSANPLFQTQAGAGAHSLFVQRGQVFSDDIALTATAYNVADNARISQVYNLVVDVVVAPSLAQEAVQTFLPDYGVEIASTFAQKFSVEDVEYDFVDLGYRFSISDDAAGDYSFSVADSSGAVRSEYSVFAQGDEYGLFVRQNTIAPLIDERFTISVHDSIENLSDEIEVIIDVDNLRQVQEQTRGFALGEDLSQGKTPNVEFNLNNPDAAPFFRISAKSTADLATIQNYSVQFVLVNNSQIASGTNLVVLFSDTPQSYPGGIQTEAGFTVFIRELLSKPGTGLGILYRQLESEFKKLSQFKDNFTWEYLTSQSTYSTFNTTAQTESFAYEPVGSGVIINASFAPSREYNLQIKLNDETRDGAPAPNYSLRQIDGSSRYEIMVAGDAVITNEDLRLLVFATNAAGQRITPNVEVELDASARFSVREHADLIKNFYGVVAEEGVYVDSGERFIITDSTPTNYDFDVRFLNTELGFTGIVPSDYKVVEVSRKGAEIIYKIEVLTTSDAYELGTEIELTINERGVKDAPIEFTTEIVFPKLTPITQQILTIAPDTPLAPAQTEWIDLGTEAKNAQFRIVAKEGVDAPDTSFVFNVFRNFPADYFARKLNDGSYGISIKQGKRDLEELRAKLEGISEFRDNYEWEYRGEAALPTDTSFTTIPVSGAPVVIGEHSLVSSWFDTGIDVYFHLPEFQLSAAANFMNTLTIRDESGAITTDFRLTLDSDDTDIGEWVRSLEVRGDASFSDDVVLSVLLTPPDNAPLIAKLHSTELTVDIGELSGAEPDMI